MIRTLTLLTAVMSITCSGRASNPPAGDLVAVLDLRQLPAGTKDGSAQSIAFVSDSSIALGLCPAPPAKGCSLSLLHRDGSELRLFASNSRFLPGMSLHVASEGRILAGPIAGSPAVLFSADLSSAQEIPNVHASQSGNTAAEFVRGGWKLHRFNLRLEHTPGRSGSFDLCLTRQ